MKPIDQPSELRSYYQDTDVVAGYIKRRTGQPLNGVLHAHQVRFLNRVIAERAPHSVLEVAPGPARLTAELSQVPLGVGADFSPGMLATARQRTRAAGLQWHFIRADAFRLPVGSEQFDLVFTLRFVRHFHGSDRARLYRELRRVIRPGGALVVDAQNRSVRDAGHVRRHAVYDELYTGDELRSELQGYGFRVQRMEGIIKHHAVQRSLNRLRGIGLHAVARQLISALEWVPGRNPSTWMLLCERT